ncbi:MAG TPA: protein translocase subunit SecF [Candidatus Paceibacterota bacterium]|nr:protein translocase subunit SecF [Candidatus Paceibacterota bacterium]
MFIVNHRNWFFALTGIIVVSALVSFFAYGLHLGIDFTGGTLAQVSYTGERPSADALTRNLDDAGFKDFSLREYGTNGYTLRAQTLTEAQRENLAAYFTPQNASAHVDSLNEIGPTIGVELRNKALLALGLVLLCILFFIAFAFRKVSEPVSSWWYGLIALVTLLHDVIVPVGFYAALGHFLGAQVDTLFVTAVLTVLGFSIHDTIVVFDRTRENLRVNQDTHKKESFDVTAGHALNQTFVRSLNTSLTVLITLLVLFFVGPESTKDFALTLLVGIIAGTYSSIFLATPLLVEVGLRKQK